MTAFNYQALEKSGKESKGIIEADSEKQARQLLRDKSLIPLSLHAIKASKKPSGALFARKVSVNDLSLITRQLATLLEAGIPIEQAIQGVSEQVEKAQLKSILQGVRSKVLEGFSLAQALEQFPHAFPELYCSTVGAGEQTGRLDMVLTKLADYTENQQKTRQKVTQALIYPAVMVFVSIGIISFLLSFVVPKIIDVFHSTGQTLPELTLVLIGISNFLKNYGLYLLVALIIAIILFKQALRREAFKYKWHLLLLKIPLIAYMIKAVNTARYASTFGILFSAGVNVLESMRVSASLISNLPMRKTIGDASTKVKEGSNISLALKQTHYFTPMAIHLISSGENSGQLSDMLQRAADNLDNDVKRIIETGLTLFEPLIIMVMGSVVLFIVLATLLPIFSMDQMIT